MLTLKSQLKCQLSPGCLQKLPITDSRRKSLVGQGKESRFLYRRLQKTGGPKGHRARISGGSFLRARTEGISPANFVRPTCQRSPPYSKHGWVSQSVCPSVCRSALNALKAGNVFLRDFAYVRIQTGAKQPQKKKKKEATGYFSCHKVTSHTEEMNNIRKTDPGYQKSSVS